MTRDSVLGVFIGARQVGWLVPIDSTRLGFEYAPDWLDADDGIAISHSLPLRSGLNRSTAAHAFFANLLPEGSVREAVSRRLGISPGNDIALLEAIGGECAGALTIVPEGATPPLSLGSYDPLEPARVAQMARRHSVLADVLGEGRLRLSLAGAQDKLPVHIDEAGKLWLPAGGAASSHILKVPARDFRHLPANEVLCLRLYAAFGLRTADARLLDVEGVKVALVTRYDRTVTAPLTITRHHQEDLCQALGTVSLNKYEAEGGPGLSQALDLVRARSLEPLRDADQLLTWQMLNLLVGNSDGHGKNLSLLYETLGHPTLAPFYDIVCTRTYSRVDRHLAMAIGGERDPGRVARRHWEALSDSLGIGRRLVLRRVGRLTDELPDVFDEVATAFVRDFGDSPIIERVRRVVLDQCRRTRTLLR